MIRREKQSIHVAFAYLPRIDLSVDDDGRCACTCTSRRTFNTMMMERLMWFLAVQPMETKDVVVLPAVHNISYATSCQTSPRSSCVYFALQYRSLETERD